MRNLYMPTTDSGRDLWVKNFAAKLPQYAAKYGINNTEVADIQLSALNHSYWLNYKNQLEELKKKITQFKTEMNLSQNGSTFSVAPAFPALGSPPASVAPGIFVRISSIVQRIKKHLLYTTADGNDLGIEGTPAIVDLQAMKPRIAVRFVEAGKPEIVWRKKGMSALEIHVDRGDGYELLAIDVSPNYIDEFALDADQTAVWKYKSVYLLNDKRVGQFSDEVKVTVTGEVRA